MFKKLSVKNRVRSVVDALKKEKSILLEGPLVDIMVAVEHREHCLGELVSLRTDLSEVDLKPIRKMARENTELLEASLVGIRFAMRDVKARAKASKSMGTYTESGVIHPGTEATGRTDRKA